MTLGTYADAVDLFDRRYRLQLDTVVIEALQVQFEIKRSLSAKTPNSCSVKVYNLSEATRLRLQQLDSVFVSLEAGYAQGSSLLFRGELRELWSERAGSDWVSNIESADGAKRKKQRVNKSFPKGTPVATVIKECAKALKVGLGNVDKRADLAQFWNVKPAKFALGYVATGDAMSALDRVCRSCGLEWSIQDNQLQLLERGKALAEQAVLLSPQTGLIGSPAPEHGKGKKGLVRVETLMIPGLYPGRRVKLETRHVSGAYRVETTNVRGDFFGNDWGAEVELRHIEDR